MGSDMVIYTLRREKVEEREREREYLGTGYYNGMTREGQPCSDSPGQSCGEDMRSAHWSKIYRGSPILVI